MSKEHKDPQIYLGHILECIELTERYLAKKTFKDFLADQFLQDAIIRRLEIIGEAVTQMPAAFKDKYPDVLWRDIADMRNRLIHEYFGVEFSLTWDVIKHELAPLKKSIKEILKKEKSR